MTERTRKVCRVPSGLTSCEGGHRHHQCAMQLRAGLEAGSSDTHIGCWHPCMAFRLQLLGCICSQPVLLARLASPYRHRTDGQCAKADCASQVHVRLKADSIEVCMGPRTPLRGAPFASIKVEDSTWYVQDGLLTVQLLKRNRRGHYANGSSNADTFWMSVSSLCLQQHLFSCLMHAQQCWHMHCN